MWPQGYPGLHPDTGTHPLQRPCGHRGNRHSLMPCPGAKHHKHSPGWPGRPPHCPWLPVLPSRAAGGPLTLPWGQPGPTGTEGQSHPVSMGRGHILPVGWRCGVLSVYYTGITVQATESPVLLPWPLLPPDTPSHLQPPCGPWIAEHCPPVGVPGPLCPLVCDTAAPVDGASGSLSIAPAFLTPGKPEIQGLSEITPFLDLGNEFM